MNEQDDKTLGWLADPSQSELVLYAITVKRMWNNRFTIFVHGRAGYTLVPSYTAHWRLADLFAHHDNLWASYRR